MVDPRIKKLAENLVGYSVAAKKGDKVLIEAYDIDSPLVECLVKEIRARGAYAFVEVYDGKIQRALLMNADEEYFNLLASYARGRMEDMDCYIGIRGSLNSFEDSDVPAENKDLAFVSSTDPPRTSRLQNPLGDFALSERKHGATCRYVHRKIRGFLL